MKRICGVLLFTLLAAGVTLAGPMPYEKIVVPEPVCGPVYISVFGGGSFYEDGEAFMDPAFTDADVSKHEYGFDNGWILGAAVGVRTANHWRFELEASLDEAPTENSGYETDLAGNRDSFETLRGEVETSSLMLNGIKEFPSLGFARLRPYLGAGIGLSNVEIDLAYREPDGTEEGARGDDIVLSYHFLTGVSYDVTECLEAYLEYRVRGHGDLEDFYLDIDDPGSGSLDLGWSQHVILGARIFF